MENCYVVMGYDTVNEDGVLWGVIEITVYATDEKQAIRKAKKLVKKGGYKLHKVYEVKKEHDHKTNVLREEMKEYKQLMRDLIKAIKKSDKNNK